MNARALIEGRAYEVWSLELCRCMTVLATSALEAMMIAADVWLADGV